MIFMSCLPKKIKEERREKAKRKSRGEKTSVIKEHFKKMQRKWWQAVGKRKKSTSKPNLSMKPLLLLPGRKR